MTELSNLPNVGKVLEENLRKIVVTTEEQFKEKGTEQIFFEIRQKGGQWRLFAYAIWNRRSEKRQACASFNKRGNRKVKVISITHKKTLSQIFFGNSKKV